VSVVIANYNAMDQLKVCLDSLLSSNYKKLEIIVVDNNSKDGSYDFLLQYRNNACIKIIHNLSNLGLAIARNQGRSMAVGKYVAFIDNDARVHPDWLGPVVATFEADSTLGACQCKLVLDESDGNLDSLGEFFSQYGFLVHAVKPGAVKDLGQYNEMKEIFSAKGAAMVFRKDVLDKIGGFDDDYFLYLEETDACWKVWLMGKRVVLIPQSTVYHKFGTTARVLPERASYFAKYHGSKNYVATLVKNLSFINLFKILPIHIVLWLGLVLYFLSKGDITSSRYIGSGILWNFRNLRRLLSKRKATQNIRISKDSEIFRKVMVRISLRYLIENFLDTRQVGYAMKWRC